MFFKQASALVQPNKAVKQTGQEEDEGDRADGTRRGGERPTEKSNCG